MKAHVTATRVNPPAGQVEADVILYVNCLLGTNPSGEEGIKLDGRPHAPNFDTTIENEGHGETLFVSRSHSGG
jgi:hypothetical protein